MQTAEVVEFPMVRDSKYLGVIIEPSRDDNLSEQALKLLKDYYCIEGEDSPQQALQEHQLHTHMEIWNSHKEFTITFQRGGSCLHHLYYQTHLCRRKGKSITYFLFSNLRSRFIGRSY